MPTALITGACGFIGRNLIQKLLRSDYTIIAVDCVDAIHSCYENDPRVTYIHSDLSDVNSGFDNVPHCDMLFHLAWKGVTAEFRSDITVQKKNIDICVNVIDLAKRLAIPRVIFVGSTMEYCYNEKPICEESLPTPSNCYGSCKVAARFICSQLCADYGIEFEYAVIASIYGKGREDSNVIYYCIKSLLQKKSPDVSSCVQLWDYVHIDDAVHALQLIGEKGIPGSFYSIGTGENKPLKYYISVISSLIDDSIPINFGAIAQAGNRIANSSVNIHKLTQDTGYKPSYCFSDGIAEVVDYYRNK